MEGSTMRVAAAALVLIGLAGCDRAGGAGEGAGGEAAAVAAAPGAGAAAGGLVERGRYLVAIMDCAGCHNKGAFSPQPDEGHFEGGTVGFEVPQLGVFYPPNLTPHPEAGLGRWSEADIVRVLKTGMRPDGRQLAPAMPWRAYSAISDEDARAVAAYLRSLPPSDRRVPPPGTVETARAPYLTVRMPEAAAP